MIHVQDLSKSYGGHLALQGVTLGVEAGDMFGLIGPNGAGKTTLIRILATLLQPTRGSATVDGHDVLRHPGKIPGMVQMGRGASLATKNATAAAIAAVRATR